MNAKKRLGIKDLREVLKKRGIVILGEDKGVISIDARGGTFITEVVLPPNEEKIRVVRFSKKIEDYLDPALFGFAAKLGKGLEILLYPLSNKKIGDLKKSPSFLTDSNAMFR